MFSTDQIDLSLAIPMEFDHYKYIHQKRAKPEKFIIDPEMGLEILKAAHYLEC